MGLSLWRSKILGKQLHVSGLRVLLGDGVLTNTPLAYADLPYSSGTTGKPKGVQLSHRNVECIAQQVCLNAVWSKKRLLTLAVAFAGSPDSTYGVEGNYAGVPSNLPCTIINFWLPTSSV